MPECKVESTVAIARERLRARETDGLAPDGQGWRAEIRDWRMKLEAAPNRPPELDISNSELASAEIRDGVWVHRLTARVSPSESLPLRLEWAREIDLLAVNLDDDVLRLNRADTASVTIPLPAAAGNIRRETGAPL